MFCGRSAFWCIEADWLISTLAALKVHCKYWKYPSLTSLCLCLARDSIYQTLNLSQKCITNTRQAALCCWNIQVWILPRTFLLLTLWQIMKQSQGKDLLVPTLKPSSTVVSRCVRVGLTAKMLSGKPSLRETFRPNLEYWQEVTDQSWELPNSFRALRLSFFFTNRC